MNIEFTVDTINHLTGNTMRKAGDIMDCRDDYGAALVSRGYAINLDAKPEPKPESSPPPESKRDWSDVHTNKVRAMAKDAGVWRRGMSRENMIALLETA